jgi:hypothetical protein
MSKRFFGVNGYYSLGGIEPQEQLYVELGPQNVPAAAYAQWFLPSYEGANRYDPRQGQNSSMMNTNPHYRQWGVNNKATPRMLKVRRAKI